MLMASVAGCGGSSGDSKAAETTAAAAAAETTAAAESAASESTEVTYKESVTIGTSAQISVIDPQGQSNLQHDQLFKMSHDRLVAYNHETGEIEPELAESWEISDDGLVYTFKLVEGSAFHDGSAFTANDVVYTINRGYDSAVVVAKLKSLDTVEAVDDYTVKMTLKAPNVDWLMNLSNCVSAVLPSFEGNGIIKQYKSVDQSDCDEVGFCTTSYFIEVFRARFGVTPLQYRKGME